MMTRLSPQGHSAPPLHLAASNREVNSVLSLLSAGADPDSRSVKTRTWTWTRVHTYSVSDKNTRNNYGSQTVRPSTLVFDKDLLKQTNKQLEEWPVWSGWASSDINASDFLHNCKNWFSCLPHLQEPTRSNCPALVDNRLAESPDS